MRVERGFVDQRADQRVRAARGSPTFTCAEQLLEAARPARRRCFRGRSAGAASCSAGRRSRRPKTGSRARQARGRRSARRSSHCCRRARAATRPKRWATRGPTARPIAVDPVADTSAMRGSSTSASPTSRSPWTSCTSPSGASPKPRSARRTSCHHRFGAQRRLLARLPDHGIAAHQRQRRVPRPDRDREIERADHQHRPERMPLLHHPVVRAARWRWSGRRAGATGRRRSRRCRSSPALRRGSPGMILPASSVISLASDRLGLAQLLAEQPDELAAPRRRHRPPFEEGRGGTLAGAGRDRRTSPARSACRRSASS